MTNWKKNEQKGTDYEYEFNGWKTYCDGSEWIIVSPKGNKSHRNIKNLNTAKKYIEKKVATTDASKKYDEKNTMQFKMKLNLNTDQDIIERLETQSNKQGYIKKLIRKDIEEKMTIREIMQQHENDYVFYDNNTASIGPIKLGSEWLKKLEDFELDSEPTSWEESDADYYDVYINP